jgi:hypothetical protein
MHHSETKINFLKKIADATEIEVKAVVAYLPPYKYAAMMETLAGMRGLAETWELDNVFSIPAYGSDD